ncbi:hypothetical protein D1164_18895 [Mariniphaga sediminis]|jgi:translation initiation factor IF-1|uniref:Uncharacterized protein n=1 Tax=Mariniphaga sediminis TaxID=1628158 RepID=A0A399CZY1_9BACT|nr:hypothetical protein [Mariniphaga sediminis]RIH63650.1 hypothetical protein D1164_18895 [Mariniphaga sediminis]
MEKAYRFDDQRPVIGTTVYAFRTLNGLKRFARLQGSMGSQRFWEITGNIVSDDGSEDGIQIRVVFVKQVY